VDAYVETQVDAAVASWLRWVPRWAPTSAKGRTRVCLKCFGSPVLAAADVSRDVPHGVQHALNMRMTHIVDAAVLAYTTRNLPLLAREEREAEARKAHLYAPDAGLDPEFQGLDPDPLPDPEAPFLFTIAELASAPPTAGTAPAPRAFTEEEKVALRQEIALADAYADDIGRRVCRALEPHRRRIAAAINECVEPQVQALLDQMMSAFER
jgi:hypothetical protein